ncbi:PAS/PAC sensor signal transduction histidine kinase [Dethiosulfovibrio peptidovorans DSM 11002]|uniref:PAS/PAC sensor signal transduction histidine kinase n=1 Tax=Dethiosulfovibrio peptidovorans DSM 11002 TaxID=469381 RepID=D2Z2V9_9BACT|nr:PAS domain S-box protein [Dethiosulfovibrio peptidovorans]EFC90177.1 PAS/PAC sensor signal transduction histidine kinase [Dethiosulfovibrio peptidovorans DSM 11002]
MKFSRMALSEWGAYMVGVIFCMVVYLGGMFFLDRSEVSKSREEGLLRRSEQLTLAARATSDRLNDMVRHFSTVSRYVSSSFISSDFDRDSLREIQSLELISFPQILDISVVTYDDDQWMYGSENRTIFEQSLHWGKLFLSRYMERGRGNWIPPFSISPGLRMMGIVYPLRQGRIAYGAMVVTLDLDRLLGHVVYDLKMGGSSYILSPLGDVVLSSDTETVGHSVFGDLHGRKADLRLMTRDVLNRSSGESLEQLSGEGLRVLAWHSARIGGQKLVLVHVSPDPAHLNVVFHFRRRLPLTVFLGVTLVILSLLFVSSYRKVWGILTEGERRYAAVLEAQTDPLIRFRSDWTITFVNQACCRFWGLSREKLIGSSLANRLKGTERLGLQSLLDGLDRGESRQGEWTQSINSPDGSERWIRWSCVPVSGVGSTGLEIQAVGRDITSLYSLQRELARRKDALNAILEGAPVPICMTGLNGEVKRFNRTGKILSANDGALRRMARRVVRQGYGIYGEELSFSDEKGNRRVFSVNVVPYKDENGGIKGTIVAGMELTEVRNIARRLLEEREDRYRKILNAIGDGVLLCRKGVDELFRVDLSNPVASEMIGGDVRPPVGRSLGEIFSSPSLRQVETLLSCSRGPVGLTGDLRRPDGSSLPVEMSLTVFSEDNLPVLLIVMKDISERLEARAREKNYARQLRKLIGRLDEVEQQERQRMAAYLHDVVGQNLASVKIRLGLAMRDASGSVREGLKQCVVLADQIISETRAMTFELGSPLLDELGFGPALERMCDVVRRDRGLAVSVKDDGSADLLDRRSRGLLYRSIRELLINVAKHAEVSEAFVSLERDGKFVVATVLDEGRGYDPENLDRSAADLSFGLLSIRERLAGMGGELICRSSPGKGTRATIKLPVR